MAWTAPLKSAGVAGVKVKQGGTSECAELIVVEKSGVSASVLCGRIMTTLTVCPGLAGLT